MALAVPPPPGPGRAMEEPPPPPPPPVGPERGAGDAELLRRSLRGGWGARGTGRYHVTAALHGLGEPCRGQAWHTAAAAAAGHGEEEEEEAVTEETRVEPLLAAGPQRVPSEGPVPAAPAGRPNSAGLRFGLLPAELHGRLLDQEDYRNRTRAVEELKRVVGGASQAALSSTPVPSLLGLISLLYTLLDDPNFKVVLGALEATHLLALRLGPRLQPFLAPLVSAAAKVLGDNKVPIRQQYSRLLLALMRAAGPQQVLALLLQHDGLRHRNSRVREEVVNVCIAALLSYPSDELDLARLASALAPALVDSKRRVRHAALEAFAVLATAMGHGRTGPLFKAVSAVELEENGDGVMHAVQARLARKTLPKLVDQGFVEYGVPLPSSGRESCLLPGADTDWLLMGSRTQSAHSYCGYHARDDALQSSSSHCACASPRRVLSAGKGKNKLPWDDERAKGREGGAGLEMPFTKGVEQFSASNDFLHSPKLRPSPGAPASDELFFSRKRASRLLFQNSLDLNSEHSSACSGAVGSHQPQISGKCGTLGCTQPRGRSSSVDTDLQVLGLNNCQQDKVCASLNFSSKTQRSFCNPTEHTMSFQGANASQGTFILPSYPSPQNNPKPVSSPADSPTKSQDNPMNFSNSWPLKSFEGLPKPSAQKQLPSQKPADITGENPWEKRSLQLKPTLVRRPGFRTGLNGSRPFPPIPCLTSPLPDKIELNLIKWRNEECEDVWLNEADLKLRADISELSVDDEEVDQEEMENSLRSLRNSAANKRAKLKKNMSDFESADPAGKADISMESPSHTSSSSTGSYSTPQRRRITSDTLLVLGTRSQPVRVSSMRHGDGNVAEAHSNTGVSGSPPSVPTYSQSVSWVANGNDRAAAEEPEPSTQQSSPSHCHAASETEIKGVLSKSAQEKVRRKKKEEKEHSPKEQQEDTDLNGKEENPWERLNEVEKLTTEKVNLCGDVLTSSRSVPLSLENVAWNLPLKRTSSLKKTRRSGLLDSDDISFGARGHYKDQIPSVTHSPEIMDQSELRPFSKPEMAVTEALALLADEDWEKKIEGLNFVRRLSAYHASTLTANLHETSLAVAQEVKNLRSGVSRAAVVCLGDLFTHLKKSMDQELDNAVKVLLHKAGESNTFIREEVDKALKAMVNNVTPARALCSLINGGQSHLHSAVRRCTAQHLSDVVERMGPERILSGTKGVADGIFPAIARLAQDSSQQTRYYGRKMLFCMMAHPDFDKTLEKYVPTKDLPYIKESVSNLCEKGLGEMPLDTPSAKGRRSHTSGAGHSRSSSTSRDALNVMDKETAEAREVMRKAAPPRSALESEEYVKDLIGLLNARDFRDRIHGIKQLLSDTENNQGFVVANIVKIFDAFKSRLHDSNSKVNQVALETMHRMVPLLKDNLTPVINMLIPAIVDNNLNSKNPGIYTAATNVIQALCQHLDNSLLLQPFCTKAQFLSGKAKQDMTEKLADLVTDLYPRKPYAVEHKVLAVLWHLLGNMTSSGSLPGAGGNVRTATAKLSKALFAHMGPSLFTYAATQPPHIKKSLEELLETTT